MFLGVIADDFSGATDIAGFLVNNGMPTVLLNGVPNMPIDPEVQAVVVSLKSRACPAAEAVDLCLGALGYLQKLGCSRFFFKYCSTFDSTAKGNIGPVTDALLNALGEKFTVICPALPLNGRTVYDGYLFVNGVPLNESSMRNHPLNPMRDANLMRLMDAQASGKTGDVPLPDILQGATAIAASLAMLREKGFSYAVLDATVDLDAIALALEDMKLVTGGSGLGGAMARLYSQKMGGGRSATAPGAPVGGKPVLLSGSCSEMTNKQNAAYRAEAPFYRVDVEKCLAGAEKYAREIADQIINAPAQKLPPLVSATVPPAELSAIQEKFGVDASRAAIEAFFGNLAVFLRAAGYDHFIVAGGETSSIVCQALKVDGFYIGPEIAPGVPWIRAINAPLSFALKSGNFGDERFFFRALDLIPAKNR